MTRPLRAAAMALALTAGPSASALDLDARTGWVQRMDLATPLGVGVVAEVRARTGDRVAEGALLVQIDDRAARAYADEAQAAFEEARQRREEGRRELDRAVELYERTVLAQHELQTAEIAAAAADAAYRRAEAALTQARLALEYTRVHAPFDALVVDVAVHPGDVVVNRLGVTPLVAVARSDRMRATALLKAEQLDRVSPGDEVQVAVAGQWRPAVVTGVAMEPGAGADAAGRYALEAEFEVGAGEVWRAGRPATLRIGEQP
ncbi:MAG: efflux RND transporter periplasmic adaptor subunit [Chromatiales bacterium]|jgi:multidrug efflux system membrane fusion protein